MYRGDLERGPFFPVTVQRLLLSHIFAPIHNGVKEMWPKTEGENMDLVGCKKRLHSSTTEDQ